MCNSRIGLKFLIICCFISFGFVQDPPLREILKGSFSKYIGNENYSCSYSIRTKCDGTGNSTNETQYKGKMIRHNNSFYFEQGGNITVDDQGYTLLISESEKVIVVQRSTGEFKNQAFEQLLELTSNNVVIKELKSDRSGYRQFLIEADTNEFSFSKSAAVYLRPDGWVEKMKVVLDREKQEGFEYKCDWVEIVYSGYTFNESKSHKLNLNHYIDIKNDKITAKNNYANYQVVSTLHINLK